MQFMWIVVGVVFTVSMAGFLMLSRLVPQDTNNERKETAGWEWRQIMFETRSDRYGLNIIGTKDADKF